MAQHLSPCPRVLSHFGMPYSPCRNTDHGKPSKTMLMGHPTLDMRSISIKNERDICKISSKNIEDFPRQIRTNSNQLRKLMPNPFSNITYEEPRLAGANVGVGILRGGGFPFMKNKFPSFYISIFQMSKFRTSTLCCQDES